MMQEKRNRWRHSFSLEFSVTALCFASKTFRRFRWAKRTSNIQYGYRKCRTHPRVFSQTLARGNCKYEIRHRKRGRMWKGKIDHEKNSGLEKGWPYSLTVARAYRPPVIFRMRIGRTASTRYDSPAYLTNRDNRTIISSSSKYNIMAW